MEAARLLLLAFARLVAASMAAPGMVGVELCDTFPDGEGYHIFRRFEQALSEGDKMITIDAGRNITFVRTVVRRTP